MSCKPDYECSQKELKSRAWAHAGSFGIIALLLSSAVLGIALLLGATIAPEVFAWTIFASVFVVVGIARLLNQVPSTDSGWHVQSTTLNGKGKRNL